MENSYIEAFACYNKNEKIRFKSSSGGVFSLIANAVLKSNGVVYAVVYDEKFNAFYRRITNVAELENSYGSKYVEAILGNTFIKVKEDLEDGYSVLFIGTPCHCEGLMSFLVKNYDSLLCVDFICHGMPSKRVWRTYIENEAQKSPKIKKINMRSKDKDWKEYGLKISTEKGIDKFESKVDNVFLRGFLRDLYLRPSCHECRFKGIERKTDITIGDFWGALELLEYEKYKDGISVVIVHSNKGLDCMASIKENLVTFDVTTDDIILKNSGLIKSSKLTINRERFFNRFNKGENLKRIVYDITGKTLISKVRIRLLKFIVNNR